MRVFRNISELPAFNNAVITIGSFDGVHSAHQKIIHRLVQLSNEIGGESVVITFDPHPRSVIYPKDNTLSLLTSLDEKLDLLEKYGVENVVIVPFSVEFSRKNPREYIERFIIGKFAPKHIIIGYDHRFGLNRQGDLSLLKEYAEKEHFDILVIPKQEIDSIAISSTRIRAAIKEGDLQFANGLLAHNYSLSGQVIHGKKIGKQLGFPTANLKLDEELKLLPREGVYAVKVIYDGLKLGGMMYIGRKPTLEGENKLSIEVNIFNFNEYIYNKEIRVELVKFIREGEKYEDLAILKQQLNDDRRHALDILSEQDYTPSKEDVAIAILNYNGRELLERYLPSVLESYSKTFDLYVIDNGSTDDSISYLEEWHPEVKIIRLTKNYGFAEGYNLGLKFIKSEYFVILNSDVFVERNWLDPIMKQMDKNLRIGVCQPKIMSYERKEQFEYAGAAGGYIDKYGYPFCRGRIFEHVEEDQGQYNDEKNVFWASGAAMIIRANSYWEAGGFDGDYFAHQEEIDLCWRVQKMGYQIKYIPQSKVYHLGGATLDYSNPRKLYLNFRNNLTTILKNESKDRVLKVILIRLFLDGVAGAKFLFSLEPLLTWNIIRAHFSFYKNLPKSLRKRKLINQKTSPSHWLSGKYSGSIVWDKFIRKVTTFTELDHEKCSK